MEREATRDARLAGVDIGFRAKHAKRRLEVRFAWQRWLLYITFVTAGVMPAVPEANDPIAIIFSACATTLFCTWLGRWLITKGAFPTSPAGLWLFAFLAIIGVSCVTASIWQTPFHLWLRAALPFFFLVFFFPLLDLAARYRRIVITAMHLGCFAWLANISLFAGSAVPLVLDGEAERITHVTEMWSAFQLPFGLVGLILTLFCPSPPLRTIRWPLAAAFTLVPFLAVSRGQIVIVVFTWLFFLRLVQRERRLQWILPVTAIGACVAFAILHTALLGSVSARFAETGSDSGGSRKAEIQYAMEEFVRSPLLGKGLGHQIPVDVTFSGDFETLARVDVQSVGYMHNVVAYLLMNLGAPGLIAYLGFALAPLGAGRLLWSKHSLSESRAAKLIMFSLLLWFCLQAAFRLIQSNLLLAAAVAVLAAETRHPDRGY